MALDTSALHEQVLRLPTIKAGMDAIFAAHAQAISDAVAAAIAKAMADADATAASVQAAAQAAIDTETATLKGEADELANDVVANTPSAPPSAS